MTILRRFLAIQAFLLWQGGFLFYAALYAAKEQGRNRLEGPAPALLQDPEVVRLYLGVRVPS